MDILNDDIVIKIIEELKRNKRVNGNKDSHAPQFIFLCGKQILGENGKISKALTRKNIRYHIKGILDKIENNGYKSCYCILSEQLYSDEMEIDILTFEKLLALISDEIIIVTESAGTYCELGAFVLKDSFMKKTIVINEDIDKYKNSFITKGPIAKLKHDNSNRVILHGGYDRIVATKEFDDKLIRTIGSNIDSKINKEIRNIDIKSLIYELAAITEIFQPLTSYELEKLYKNIFNFTTTYKLNNGNVGTVNSINDVVDLMLKMKILSSNRQLLTLNDDLSFFDFLFRISNSKKDSLRTQYLSRVYKLDANRMEKIS